MDKSAAISLLDKLGVASQQQSEFFSGQLVVYSFLTESDPGVAIIGWDGIRLRNGIIEIDDEGGGFWDFLRFRNLTKRLAFCMGATEYELFGGAVINQRLERLLIRQGFQRAVDTVPEELGGGTMEIRFKVFALSESEE